MPPPLGVEARRLAASKVQAIKLSEIEQGCIVVVAVVVVGTVGENGVAGADVTRGAGVVSTLAQKATLLTLKGACPFAS